MLDFAKAHPILPRILCPSQEAHDLVCLSRWVAIKLPMGKEFLYVDSGQAAVGELLHAVLHTLIATIAAKSWHLYTLCVTPPSKRQAEVTRRATGPLKWQYQRDIASLRGNPLAETLQQARSAPCYGLYPSRAPQGPCTATQQATLSCTPGALMHVSQSWALSAVPPAAADVDGVHVQPRAPSIQVYKYTKYTSC